VTVNVGPTAVNDSDNKAINVASSTNVSQNGINGAGADTYPTGSTFTVTGGTCAAGAPASPATNTTGVLTYTSPATAGGTCTVVYSVCNPAPNATNCATATLTVTAVAVLAQPDSGAGPFGAAFVAVPNIRTNDTVGGAPATAANSTVATLGAWPAGLTLNTTTGAVSAAATVPAGTYVLNYTLCDLSAPPICQNSTVTVTVIPAATPVPTLPYPMLMLLAALLAGIGFMLTRAGVSRGRFNG